jgi:hypothetical protein
VGRLHGSGGRVNSWEECNPHDEVIELGGIVEVVKSLNFDIILDGRIKRWYKLEVKLNDQLVQYYVDTFNKQERDELKERLEKFKETTSIKNFSYIFREYREYV